MSYGMNQPQPWRLRRFFASRTNATYAPVVQPAYAGSYPTLGDFLGAPTLTQSWMRTVDRETSDRVRKAAATHTHLDMTRDDAASAADADRAVAGEADAPSPRSATAGNRVANESMFEHELPERAASLAKAAAVASVARKCSEDQRAWAVLATLALAIVVFLVVALIAVA